MAGQNNYNKMAYNGAQPGPIMNQPLSANQIQHQVNAQRYRKPNLLSIENNPRNRFEKLKNKMFENVQILTNCLYSVQSFPHD